MIVTLSFYAQKFDISAKKIDSMVQMLSVIPCWARNHIPNRLVFQFDKFNFCQFFATFNEKNSQKLVFENFKNWDRDLLFGS